MPTATRSKRPAPRKPSPAQVKARKMKERAARNANRSWFAKLVRWTLFRVAPVGMFWGLVLREDFRVWMWAIVRVYVPSLPLLPGWLA